MNNRSLLCAVAKNESPYIVEWLAYYKYIIGFDEIIIYNNDSYDISKDLLKSLSDHNFCVYKEWPRIDGITPQQSAYMDAIKNYSEKFEWIAFLDIDEFLVLKDYADIKTCLEHFANINADSISINWLTFGSSNYDNYCINPVSKRFLYSNDPISKINRHCKSISRISNIDSINVHINKLITGSKYFHIDGTELFFDKDPNSEHISDKKYHINQAPAQINHYQLKSLDEYKNRKLKGRATVLQDHVSANIKPGDFIRSDQHCNTHDNFDILYKIKNLEKYINNIYNTISINSRQYFEEQFKLFIQQQTKKFDLI